MRLSVCGTAALDPGRKRVSFRAFGPRIVKTVRNVRVQFKGSSDQNVLDVVPPAVEVGSVRQPLFEEICSVDFLNFSFGGRSYQEQLNDSIAKTKALAAVKVELFTIPGTSQQIVWVSHNFAFLGGSLGCAEGEKIARAFEYALKHKIPICVQCRSGGARMQEGTSSLLQMAKVSVAVEQLHKAGIPFVTILQDPTYGGVSASYAMQADVRVSMSDARIGFAGPAVILNTLCEADQMKYDLKCPADFQSASYLFDNGQVDMVLDSKSLGSSPADVQSQIEALVGQIVCILSNGALKTFNPAAVDLIREVPVTERDKSEHEYSYTRSRAIDRPQTQDVIAQVFDSFVELTGDGSNGRDSCIRGGIATFMGRSVVVMGTFKGHTPQTMQDANFGMASPHGYRTALRLMRLAERFGLPVITLVDTVGAWPTFQCEREGQGEAIATNLTAMAGLTVPVVSLVLGEGGSGGALGICMGNSTGMLSGAYYGVISPEGAASILGHYKDQEHKERQFPLDCAALATAQGIYANQLKELGVVDDVIWEAPDSERETYKSFPVLRSRIQAYLLRTLTELSSMTPAELVSQRYQKYRALGTFNVLDAEHRHAVINQQLTVPRPSKKAPPADTTPSKLIRHIAEESVCGKMSRYKGLAPANCPAHAPAVPAVTPMQKPAGWTNAKKVLDEEGPEAMARWVKAQQRLLLTDTTMRDAHQSHLATRVRSEDLVKSCTVANEVLKNAFSVEVWGGATFDVCMRFLDECPWERLREIRKACPDICTQMLLRGANAVGYTSYPDNVVAQFVRLAAKNGMDVFRIFDCFNDVESMQVSIDAVRAANKVADVCICYTGDVLNSKIYNLAYYKDVAARAAKAGAHMLTIKDMSGLLRPQECGPLLDVIHEVTDLPIHFHTHATSSGAIATCYEMARLGCDIIDCCTASMADGTSQPSMNVLVAMLEGAHNDTGINYLDLEGYDMYWARVRDMYSPFESGMKSGSARVYEHQIPGGQYSNLYQQCRAMGLWDRWEEVLDAYRDANQLFGDVIKVTPSSKCVGDMALYLVTRNMKASDVLDPAKAANIDFPESVVSLLRGDLGFPHRGFPADVEKAILKTTKPRTVRPGLGLPPCNFTENIASLSASLGMPISEEDGMSSLMYPKVFAEYMRRRKAKGALLRYLPTPVYLYGMAPGDKFTMTVPAAKAKSDALAPIPAGTSPDALVDVTVQMQRVGPLQKGSRTVVFSVNGQQQQCEVLDCAGKFVFTGPMADPKKPGQMASPMPGVVEKVLVREGQVVAAGETLCVISAMKMEVKVTAPLEGKVVSLPVSHGQRVIEGALLLALEGSKA